MEPGCVVVVGAILIVAGAIIVHRIRENLGIDESLEAKLKERKEKAYQVSRKFMAATEISRQVSHLEHLASIADSLGLLHGKEVWQDVEVYARLLKHKCRGGRDDFHWAAADDLHNRACTAIEEYDSLR